MSGVTHSSAKSCVSEQWVGCLPRTHLYSRRHQNLPSTLPLTSSTQTPASLTPRSMQCKGRKPQPSVYLPSPSICPSTHASTYVSFHLSTHPWSHQPNTVALRIPWTYHVPSPHGDPPRVASVFVWASGDLFQTTTSNHHHFMKERYFSQLTPAKPRSPASWGQSLETSPRGSTVESFGAP